MPPPSTWTDYVENSLVGSGLVTHAAIFSYDHKPIIYGTSKDFEVLPVELENIKKAFTDSNVMRSVGMIVAGTKYTLIKADVDMLIGRGLTNGCIIHRASHCFILATFDDPFQVSCSNLVIKLASYLRDTGY